MILKRLQCLFSSLVLPYDLHFSLAGSSSSYCELRRQYHCCPFQLCAAASFAFDVLCVALLLPLQRPHHSPRRPLPEQVILLPEALQFAWQPFSICVLASSRK